jgi:hypothetical protein
LRARGLAARAISFGDGYACKSVDHERFDPSDWRLPFGALDPLDIMNPGKIIAENREDLAP